MRIIVSAITCLLYTAAAGQNLVANNSFEDVTICQEYREPCSPSGWFSVKRKVSNGFYVVSSSPTGQRSLSQMVVSRETPNRQYWETQLLCPMEAGRKYKIRLKIAASGIGPNLHDIGFYFTGNYIFSSSDTLLQPANYLSFLDAGVKKLKKGWFELSKDITASENASILLVGNFSADENILIMENRKNQERNIRLLIDDIVIEPETPTPCPDAQKIKDSLYSITRRHSDIYPRNTPPDTVAAIVKKTTDPVLPSGTDTIRINNVQFAFDRYVLSSPDTLEQFRELFARPDITKVMVLGFTDDRGSETYNKELSEKRAKEVARQLSIRFGLPASIVRWEGRGISKDYTDNNLNRRVEIHIFHGR